MNIRELILHSQEIADEINNGTQNFKLEFLSKSLDIEIDIILELFENENIIIENNPNKSISIDLLKQLLLKEPETSSSPTNLRDIILTSDKLMKMINADGEYIRVNKLCRSFNMSLKNLIILFRTENIEIEPNPNYKLRKDLLINLISIKPEILEKTNSEILNILELKINSSEETEYTKSVVLNQFIRSEQIREYAKIRANGICELCDLNAPFEDKYGKPYLESHHIIYLAKGGKDVIDNVAAICPNCHRKIHNLNLKSDIQKLLSKRNLNSV